MHYNYGTDNIYKVNCGNGYRRRSQYSNLKTLYYYYSTTFEVSITINCNL